MVSILSVFFLIPNVYAQQKSDVVVKEWRIPTIFFLSGPLAGFGLPTKWLAEEVAKDISAAGGIAGRPVVLDFCDSALDPTKATACISKAIDSKAVCMLGPLHETEMKGAMSLAVREGIFSFSGTATDEIVKQFYPWTISTIPPIEESNTYQMRLWIKHEPDIKSVVAFEDPTTRIAILQNRGFLTELGNQGKETKGAIEIPSGMTDYTPIVVRALGTKANAFIIGAPADTAALIVKGLVSRGVNPKHIYLQVIAFNAAFLEIAKGFNEGVYFASSLTYSPYPEYMKYLKEYMETHGGQPWGPFTHYAYDMLKMIKLAIENTGVTGDPVKVKEERIKIKDYAINQKNFQGLQATYDVVNGLVVRHPQRIFQLRSNEAVLVEEFRP
jgi:branched-chain amino acid transport system substrate-binding protein